MSEATLNESQEKKLKHMLGADGRYLKKQWGFRNYYCAGLSGKNLDELRCMEKLGLVVSNKPTENSVYFFATRKGAKAIGFKRYQLCKTDFPL